MDKLLEVRNFSAGYGSRTVLSDVSFSLVSGELGILLGANGSGKSTLLKGICGLTDASGDCILDGQSLQEMPRRMRAQAVGYLAQRPQMGLALTGLEVVMMGYNPVLGLLERPGQHHRRKAMEVLEELEISHLADQEFQTLSEGQRQLLLFARTLVCRPRLLLLDEADSALDYRNRQRLLRKLRDLAHQRKMGILLCTHDLPLALGYGDRLLLMESGHLLGELPMADAKEAKLQETLSRLYGQVEIIRYRGRFVLTGGTP